MRYLSVCSGIEAASVAWHPLGWQPAAFSEIEPFPSAVLAHHYPNVPNLGDMTKFKEWEIGAIDLLVGGTPCQSFSVAGLRKGLEDPRGNLALVYCGILDRFKPKWFIWENVPGVLSSSGGRDFGSFLGAVAELGYGFAYRVLDAQYFGVAQRRRRVFVVGCLGDWRSAAAVLFESHSLSGNPAPSREKGQAVAGTIAARFGISRNNHEKCVAYVAPTVIGNVEGGAATTLSSREYKGLSCGRDGMTSAAVVYGAIPIHDQATRHAGKHGDKQDGKGNGLGIGQPGDPMNTLTKGDRHAVAQPIIGGVDYENNAHGPDDVTGPLLKGSPTGGGRPLPAVALANMAVRRLTPTECERLQGFPDGYTNIPWRKKDESPDGPRYKALGNSMAVPVMKWIGQRIKQVENV